MKTREQRKHSFAGTYCLDIDGDLLKMSPEELDEHLESDIFIACGSAAGDIPEWELKEAVKKYVAEYPEN